MSGFDRPHTLGLLVLAAIFAVGGALVLEALNISLSGVRPLSFVGAVVFLKFGLFAFWPFIRREFAHREITVPPQPSQRAGKPGKRSITLWSDKDPRLDVSLFDANVPTFIINHEQKILDWNPAFALAFGEVAGLKIGGNIDAWFSCLDNFRSMAKRTDELYGEAILPLTDRERVTFVSKRFGRMVFSKIMNPIIDRSSGKFVGWTIVLNINSVGRRHEFLAALHEAIKAASQRTRYAATYEAVYGCYSGYRKFLRTAFQMVKDSKQIVDLGCGTGRFGQLVVQKSPFAKVTMVDRDKEMLRQARVKAERYRDRLSVVRQDLSELMNVPTDKFDAAVCLSSHDGIANFSGFLANVHRMLQSGGRLVMGHITPSGEVAELMDAIRVELEAKDKFDVLKTQFHQIEEYEKRKVLSEDFRLLATDEILAQLKQHGFRVDQSFRLPGGKGWLAYAVKMDS